MAAMMAGVSIALLGFTHSGMRWLQKIDEVPQYSFFIDRLGTQSPT
jgi:hypothetical protein